MTILILLSKPSVFLPDSMMLLIHSLIHSLIPSALSTERMRITGIFAREYDVSHPRSHQIGCEYWAYVYNPSSFPTILHSHFPVIARFFAVMLVIKADVFVIKTGFFMPEHTVRFIVCFSSDSHELSSSSHLPDQIHNHQMSTSSERHQGMYIYS